MIYLSLSDVLPGFLGLSGSSVLGGEESRFSKGISLPSLLSSPSYSVVVVDNEPVLLDLSEEIPFSSLPGLTLATDIYFPHYDYVVFDFSLLDASPDLSFSSVYSPAVPALYSCVEPIAFSLLSKTWRFDYFPPPADYFRNVSLSCLPGDALFDPAYETLLISSSSVSVIIPFPGDVEERFFSIGIDAFFTVLFPWVPLTLPFDVSDISESIETDLVFSPVPASGSLAVPDIPGPVNVSAFIIPPVFRSAAADLPALSDFSFSVSCYVYPVSYLSLSLPAFSPPPAPALEADPPLPLEELSQDFLIPDFSIFSNSFSVSLIPGEAVSLSSPLPSFFPAYSLIADHGSPGSFISFVQAWSTVYLPPEISFFGPVSPVLFSVSPVFLPAFENLDISEEVVVWRVGLASLNVSIFGKAF
jgi:hypothetical protein